MSIHSRISRPEKEMKSLSATEEVARTPTDVRQRSGDPGDSWKRKYGWLSG